ncbi:hypothetical protein V1278_007166 [Bradyrhizobium sp. AZCC 1577]
MNCLSNCDCSGAGEALGGVEARTAWNSLIAGFGEASPDWNRAALIDCTIPEDADGSPSLCRDPGHDDDEEQRHESGGADGGTKARCDAP